jgi:hypothetical protein
MAIDNKFDAVEALIASDERDEPVDVVQLVVKSISELPVVGELPGVQLILGKIGQRYERRQKENHLLMVQTLWEETKRLSDEHAGLKEQIKGYVKTEEFSRLFEEASNKSADLTDKKRVERIGKILAHRIRVGPMTPPERVEQLMRAAREMSDQDVEILSQIYRAQFRSVSSALGLQVDIDAINKIWKESPPKIPGMQQGDLESLLLKQQGLGLIRAVDRRETALGPNETPFVLSTLGADFIRYMRGTSTDDEP